TSRTAVAAMLLKTGGSTSSMGSPRKVSVATSPSSRRYGVVSSPWGNISWNRNSAAIATSHIFARRGRGYMNRLDLVIQRRRHAGAARARRAEIGHQIVGVAHRQHRARLRDGLLQEHVFLADLLGEPAVLHARVHSLANAAH